ncbi:MAG: NAD(P)H-hydrate dehydratase [Chloroflexi bacterium]|nr:NAD(P)H-hydrate dehydratase [Chloroflexota bacterium]
MKIVTVDQMRGLEEAAGQLGITVEMLMDRAGLEVARVAWDEVGRRQGARALALIGPGNNGGDGLVAARHLAFWGVETTAYLAAERASPDRPLETLRKKGVRVITPEEDGDLSVLERHLRGADVVIDAVLGTGRARPLERRLRECLLRVAEERARRPGLLVMSLDLPSGLDANTGEADPATPQADVTVTLAYPKPGLFQMPGAEKVGRLHVVDIGIPAHLAEGTALELLTSSWAAGALPARPTGAHKGTFGKVMVVGGSPNYLGAPYLACSGALRVGVGYVTLATGRSVANALAAKLTEATFVPLPEDGEGGLLPEAVELVRQALVGYDVLLLGCGLGQSEGAERLVRGLLFSGKPLEWPLVVDADGLNLIAQVPRWWERLQAQAVLTPHPGEMGRLVGVPAEQVNRERLSRAREAARQWGVHVVLKGAYTVIASPEGPARVAPFANPALATPGTGDVLAGAIAGLMAQGVLPLDAAACGVFLHGAAGELVRRELGDAGPIAGDLLPALPRAIKGLKEGVKFLI